MKPYKLNIGSNRGRARLWLQGTVLLDAGLTRGTRYNIEYDATAQVLILKADGARKVAGRAKKGTVVDFPIIDINTTALDELVNPTSGQTLGVAVIMPNPDGLTIVLQNAELLADLDRLEAEKVAI
jgi:hypothetical protein